MHVPLLLYGTIILFGYIASFAARPYTQTINWLIIIGGPLTAALIFCVGRLLIDRKPTPRRTVRITYGVHLLVDLLVVFALVKVFQMAKDGSGWIIPLPARIGQHLTFVTGALYLLSLLNLAWDGMGAPASFLGSTQKVARRKMYTWTRNPMVLILLANLFSVGLWLQSPLFLLWVGLLILPLAVAFLKIYEERELEIRFGPSYLAYKNKTPMIWPQKPNA